MKAILDLPAPLLKELKAEAAASGQALSALVAELVAAKLQSRKKSALRVKKWANSGVNLSPLEYRKMSEEEAAEMQAVRNVGKKSVVEVISEMRR